VFFFCIFAVGHRTQFSVKSKNIINNIIVLSFVMYVCVCVCVIRIIIYKILTVSSDIYTERAHTHTHTRAYTSMLCRAELAAQNPKCIDHHYNVIILLYTLRVHITITIIIIIYACVIGTCCMYIYCVTVLSAGQTHRTHTSVLYRAIQQACTPPDYF